MSVYIKIAGTEVTLAGTVANQAMLDAGYIPYDKVIPQPTEKETKLAWDTKTNSIVLVPVVLPENEAKAYGKLYGQFRIPFRNDDALALLQVQAAFTAGESYTVIEFTNGTKMPMTPTEFPAFGAWFAAERNKFFKG